jgi:hypothetical protein
MAVRPQRPGDGEPFKISNGLWSLAEFCWAHDPQKRPTALAVCDTIRSVLPSPVMPRFVHPASPRPSDTPAGDIPPNVDSRSTSVSPQSSNPMPQSSPSLETTSATEIFSDIFYRTDVSADTVTTPPSAHSVISSVREPSGHDQPLCAGSIDSVTPSTDNPAEDLFGVAEPIPNANMSGPSPRRAPQTIEHTSKRENLLPMRLTRTAPTTSTETESMVARRRNSLVSWIFHKRQSSVEPPLAPNPTRAASGFRPAVVGHTGPRSKDPSMELWFLNDLLERWITRSSGKSVVLNLNHPLDVTRLDLLKDKEFQDIFLATYPIFTNSMEVFQALRACFDAAASGDDPADTRAFRRHTYVAFLKFH